VRDQVSDPYKTRGNIFLIFKFLEWRQKILSELNGHKHSLNLICNYFLHECSTAYLKASVYTYFEYRIKESSLVHHVLNTFILSHLSLWHTIHQIPKFLI